MNQELLDSSGKGSIFTACHDGILSPIHKHPSSLPYPHSVTHVHLHALILTSNGRMGGKGSTLAACRPLPSPPGVVSVVLAPVSCLRGMSNSTRIPFLSKSWFRFFLAYSRLRLKSTRKETIIDWFINWLTDLPIDWFTWYAFYVFATFSLPVILLNMGRTTTTT